MVSDEMIIHSLESRKPGQEDQDLAKELGITKGAFSQRKAKLSDQIVDAAKEYLKKQSLTLSRLLLAAAINQDVQAIKLAMEIGGAYIPASKQQIQVDDQAGVIYTVPKVPIDSGKIKADHKAKMKLIKDKKAV
jgi:hypothetical protein